MKKAKKIISLLLVAVFVCTGLTLKNIKVQAASGQSIVEYAKKFQGTPYVWGGTTPKGFDCSGFVQYVYRNACGIELPRDTYGQIEAGTRISQNQLQPGDLVFPSTEHVGIYIGGGQMIHAPHTGDVVKISSVYKFYAGVRISGVTQYPKVASNAKPIKNSYMLIVPSSQPVRTEPLDSAPVVRTLNHGDRVDIYAQYREWSLIARGNTQQWIRSTYLAPAVPTADKGTENPIITGLMLIVPDPQVARIYPSDTALVSRTLNHGDRVDVYAQHGKWSLIARGNTQQWIRSTYLAPAVPTADKGTEKPIKTSRYKIIQSSVTARIYPSDTAWASRTLKKGEVVDIYAEHGDWYLIARGRQAQWVKKSVLQPV